MLEFSSLLMASIVLYAHRRGDTVMHDAWLALLCSSLIHHASGYKYGWLEQLDRILCKANSVLCASRNWPLVTPQHAAVWGLGVYMVVIYYGGYAERHKLVHASIHAAASAVALLSTI